MRALCWGQSAKTVVYWRGRMISTSRCIWNNYLDSKTDIDQEISDILEKVGLDPNDTLNKYPHQLSGGERQRLMIARALLCKPKFILADEPVSMVDASLRSSILSELKSLSIENNIHILYITHDLTTVYNICDDIMVMKMVFV